MIYCIHKPGLFLAKIMAKIFFGMEFLQPTAQDTQTGLVQIGISPWWLAVLGTDFSSSNTNKY